MPKLEPYSRRLPYSYALGVFPCLQLMEVCPERALRLLLHPDGLGSEGVEKLRAICARHGVREELAERVLRRESRKDNCYAAIVFEKFESPLEPSACHVVLCQVSDSGNLGTAMRSMLAFGVRDLALILPCADAFEPHTLRSSMGAFTRLRVRGYDSFDDYRAEFPDRQLYPFMLDGAKTLNSVARSSSPPWTLIFGNEASGLPAEFAGVGQSVMIPQSPEVDSLNLSVALSVGLYMFTHGQDN